MQAKMKDLNVEQSVVVIDTDRSKVTRHPAS
jgi:hypothetical protein